MKFGSKISPHLNLKKIIFSQSNPQTLSTSPETQASTEVLLLPTQTPTPAQQNARQATPIARPLAASSSPAEVNQLRLQTVPRGTNKFWLNSI